MSENMISLHNAVYDLIRPTNPSLFMLRISLLLFMVAVLVIKPWKKRKTLPDKNCAMN